MRFGADPYRDPERGTNLPVWARRDEGPMNTYIPGPISSEPLVNTYDWGKPALISGVVIAIISVLALVNGAQAGRFQVVATLVIGWLLYVGYVWLRGRAGLQVEGAIAHVRRWQSTATFTGPDVAAVSYVHNGFSPDFRLRLTDGRRVYIATSRLERGHSTLFEWLLRFAPQAQYDKGSLKIRERLMHRGLIAADEDEAPRPSAPSQARAEPVEIATGTFDADAPSKQKLTPPDADQEGR